MEISESIKQYIGPGKKYAILGIGSALRSDDNAGMYFVEYLGRLIQRDDLLLIAGSNAPENFTGVIKKFVPDLLFIIDAAHMGLLPGEFQILPAGDIGGVSFSTHMLPLSVMMEYLASEVGCVCVFVGIQPKCTDQGFHMCGEVRKGTEKLAGIFMNAFR